MTNRHGRRRRQKRHKRRCADKTWSRLYTIEWRGAVISSGYDPDNLPPITEDHYRAAIYGNDSEHLALRYGFGEP